jgi:DNA end-binding protein Ku
VERSALVKGYEVSKDRYVRVTDEELKALEGEASKMIDIAEFVPLAKVDPIYFERTYYLGADKGGEKPYRLLADAMEKSGQVALATFVMRGKESLVLIRAAQGGLMLHTMYFADEVRAFADVDKGESAKIKEGELELAIKLIDGLAAEDFDPTRYTDAYRERVMELLNRKAEGQELTAAPPAAKRRQVIDLMEALRESLATRKPPTKAAKKPEPAAARAVASARKAAGGKK